MIDHLVLTTSDESACLDFHTRVLGMQLEIFVGGTPPVERWPVIEGPVMHTGATGRIGSVCVRDPDLDLIEISEPA